MEPIVTTLVREYDFRTMRDLAEFDTQYIWPRDTIINREAQYYVDPAAHPEHSPFALGPDGLAITARPTPPELAGVTPQPFVSGVLTTRSRGHSQLFGRWVVRARLPSARGAWPGLWLLPTFKSWPQGVDVLPEIDIAEAVAAVSRGVYHGSIHTRETGRLVSTGHEFATGKNLVGEMHDYGLTWTPEHIAWDLDGVELARVATPADMLTEPRHLLINLAVGGSWGGDAAKGGAVPVPEDYPASLDVESVRIYTVAEPAPKADEDSAALFAARAAMIRYGEWLASDPVACRKAGVMPDAVLAVVEMLNR